MNGKEDMMCMYMCVCTNKKGIFSHKKEGDPTICDNIHSSSLPWSVPWTEEPGRLQSIGSLRVRHD